MKDIIKPTIIWDVDDVLNTLMRSWFEEAWCRDHPECSLVYRDLVSNPPCEILGITREEYLDSLDAYRLSGAYSRLEPGDDILHWFKNNGGDFRHVALTSTPLRAASLSAEWVIRNFGLWIRSFSFVPSRRSGEEIPCYDDNKGDFLHWLGRGTFLVDDNRENIVMAESLGMKTLLFPQPWNGCMLTARESLEILTC